jgi:hypothetical protein
MTEEQWLACDDPTPLLGCLRDSPNVSDRKLRLLAVAWSRRVWRRLTSPASRRMVETAERYADGLASEGDLRSAWDEADSAFEDLCSERGFEDEIVRSYAPAEVRAAFVAAWAGEGDAWAVVETAASLARKREQPAYADLLRDIFNPFRPITIAPSCLTPQVVALAQAAYEERLLPSGHLDPARLSVLADALEDAGCSDAELLEHLRGGLHVRGCWAVDAVLGRC